MTTTTRNEAAELHIPADEWPLLEQMLDEAKAEGAREAVERIRAGLHAGMPLSFWDTGAATVLTHFLDEEAAR